MLYCPALKDRVFRSTRSAFSPPAETGVHANRPQQYKVWTNSQMDKALEAVVQDGFTVRRAAAEFNVPKSTLGDRVSGRVKQGAVSGPQKYLSTADKELTRFLLGCAAIGYAKSRKPLP